MSRCGGERAGERNEDRGLLECRSQGSEASRLPGPGAMLSTYSPPGSIMKASLVLFSLVVATSVGAQAPTDSAVATQPPSVELPPELARVLTDYEVAWRKGGAEVAKLFTEDGFVLPGGRPPVRGRGAIAEHYGGGHGPLALRAFAYATEGSIGYILGGYATDRGKPDMGKFTLTLRRAPDGRWMIVSDMDNMNRRGP